MTDPGLIPAFGTDLFAGNLKIGTPVATLQNDWRYGVIAVTGRPGVSILWLGEIQRLICKFYLSVAPVWADPPLG